MKENPETLRKMLLTLKERGLFEVINGIVFGKAQDEVFYEEDKQMLIEVVDNSELPIVYNVNFGHATPRCILPIGVKVRIDTNNQEIFMLEDTLHY